MPAGLPVSFHCFTFISFPCFPIVDEISRRFLIHTYVDVDTHTHAHTRTRHGDTSSTNGCSFVRTYMIPYIRYNARRVAAPRSGSSIPIPIPSLQQQPLPFPLPFLLPSFFGSSDGWQMTCKSRCSTQKENIHSNGSFSYFPQVLLHLLGWSRSAMNVRTVNTK